MVAAVIVRLGALSLLDAEVCCLCFELEVERESESRCEECKILSIKPSLHSCLIDPAGALLDSGRTEYKTCLSPLHVC